MVSCSMINAPYSFPLGYFFDYILVIFYNKYNFGHFQGKNCQSAFITNIDLSSIILTSSWYLTKKNLHFCKRCPLTWREINLPNEGVQMSSGFVICIHWNLEIRQLVARFTLTVLFVLIFLQRSAQCCQNNSKVAKCFAKSHRATWQICFAKYLSFSRNLS